MRNRTSPHSYRLLRPSSRLLALILTLALTVTPIPFATHAAEETPSLTQEEAQKLYQKFYDFYLLINNPDKMADNLRYEDYDSDDIIDKSYTGIVDGQQIYYKHIYYPAKKSFETPKKLIAYAESVFIPELAEKALDFCEKPGHYLIKDEKLYTDRWCWAPAFHNLVQKCTLVSVDGRKAVLQADVDFMGEEKQGIESFEIELAFTEDGWRISGGTLIEELNPKWHEKYVPQTADNTALTAWTAVAILSLAVLGGAAGCKLSLSRKDHAAA